MLYPGLQDGLYTLRQRSDKLGLFHYGILDVGNRLGLPSAHSGNPIVVHQKPPCITIDRLDNTGPWSVIGRISDELCAAKRMDMAFRNPGYNMLNHNCEHFVWFVATGKRESPQLRAGVVFFVLAILFASQDR
jgi:hypothetical protein